MANLPPSHYLDSGQLGEDLVAKWLESTGWVILHRRFACRWGEIDIIAQNPGSPEEQRGKGAEADNSSLRTQNSALSEKLQGGSPSGQTSETQHCILTFVEVKTRKLGSWDAGGRSAITLQKQVKISRTAGIFLAEYPEKADYICRFDVAIVSCQRSLQGTRSKVPQEALASSSIAGYQFYLQEYIPAAFDVLIDS
ncbi:YraN family protein [Dendronalium sp. ChiSLP03b]|uniref:YraN family protein n=1 Tax=Dendronalium sp. ChiSLP03b TaxID=3075381 RepID=UPI002AD28C75|nr:YraN family protein [Dendronalium sp. ChiSLP03b]MDZ8207701.1 YraN family protein [Dendronalium sp. ChiSLP03b]